MSYSDSTSVMTVLAALKNTGKNAIAVKRSSDIAEWTAIGSKQRILMNGQHSS